ncbi:MAG: cytochrome b [Hoeflea sp.]|uniref:cytochrome b n=1 Tax=Hoeflea sp. TaxID=1940281 RepID=UPI0032EB14FC
MTHKSSTDSYGSVAIGVHWLTAVLIVGLLASGVLAENAADPATKATLLTLHAPMGIAVLVLTLFRIVWWWRLDTRPDPLGGNPAWQEKLAKAVHLLLYMVMIGMAASGIGMFVLSGSGDILFGGAPGPLPDFDNFAPRGPHGIGAKLLMALLVLHAGAALYHHFLRRDATLRRMWFASTK